MFLMNLVSETSHMPPKLNKVAATMMACEPRLMQQEQAFLARLETIRRFELAADGALLLISEDQRSIGARRM
jgi:heat shock protein HslJ